jgi:putative transposase
MAEKFKGRYRITSTRKPNWDYSKNGCYFITICTLKRKNYFGSIDAGIMSLTEIGKMADRFLKDIPNHFPFVKLDAFVVMPDHIHAVLIINHNPGTQTISTIIGSYKSVVSKHSRRINPEFKWQGRFYDRIIQTTETPMALRTYIDMNVKNWN